MNKQQRGRRKTMKLKFKFIINRILNGMGFEEDADVEEYVNLPEPFWTKVILVCALGAIIGIGFAGTFPLPT